MTAWFWMQFGEKHLQVTFSTTVNHATEQWLLFYSMMALWLVQACVNIAWLWRMSAIWGLKKLKIHYFTKLHKKPCYYQLIISMKKVIQCWKSNSVQITDIFFWTVLSSSCFPNSQSELINSFRCYELYKELFNLYHMLPPPLHLQRPNQRPPWNVRVM